MKIFLVFFIGFLTSTMTTALKDWRYWEMGILVISLAFL